MRLGHSQIRKENRDSFSGSHKPSTWQRLKHRYARVAAKATALFAFVFSVGGLPACNYYQPLVSATCDGSHCNGKDGGVNDGKDGGVDGGMGDDGGVVVVPGTIIAENLIGDFLNRRLIDRGVNVHGDTDSEYPLGGLDTSANANPFTDGNEGSIGLVNSFLYRVDGSQFSPFATHTLADTDSGDVYVESQALWLDGSNNFNSDSDDIVGRLNLVVYTLKFGTPGHEAGIPVCTDAEGNDFTFCKGPGGDIDDATEAHRVKVFFLGEEWIISEMNAPVRESLPYQGRLVNGGSIKLAKEALSGIIIEGESLLYDGLRFQLDDIEEHDDGRDPAIISVLDADGNVLIRDKIDPGQTKIFVIDGKEYRFHVWKVAPGYTSGPKWADVAIFFKELELRDGQNVDHDTGLNPEYSTILGWKNLYGTPESDRPDALRTIIIFSEDIEDISTNGSRNLEAGTGG